MNRYWCSGGYPPYLNSRSRSKNCPWMSPTICSAGGRRQAAQASDRSARRLPLVAAATHGHRPLHAPSWAPRASAASAARPGSACCSRSRTPRLRAVHRRTHTASDRQNRRLTRTRPELRSRGCRKANKAQRPISRRCSRRVHALSASLPPPVAPTAITCFGQLRPGLGGGREQRFDELFAAGSDGVGLHSSVQVCSRRPERRPSAVARFWATSAQALLEVTVW